MSPDGKTPFFADLAPNNTGLSKMTTVETQGFDGI